MKVKCESAVRSLDYGRPMANYRPMVEPLLMRTMPKMVSHGIWIKEGRHILLLGIEADPVTYGLGKAAPQDDQTTISTVNRC